MDLYGRRAAAISALSDKAIARLLDNRILELELNDGKGRRGNDLSFLAKLPEPKKFWAASR